MKTEVGHIFENKNNYLAFEKVRMRSSPDISISESP